MSWGGRLRTRIISGGGGLGFPGGRGVGATPSAHRRTSVVPPSYHGRTTVVLRSKEDGRGWNGRESGHLGYKRPRMGHFRGWRLRTVKAQPPIYWDARYAPGWATTLSRQECRRSGGSPIALDSLAPPRGPINGRGRSSISCKPSPKAPEDWRSPRRWRDYEHAPPEAREVLDCASPLALSVVQQAEMRLTGGEAPVRCLPVAF